MNARNLSEMEIQQGTSVIEKTSRKDDFLQTASDCQKPAQSFYENLQEKFLSSLKSGSEQDQKQSLLEIHHCRASIRRALRGPQIPRNQFLSMMQCFAESHGFVFGKHLQNMRFGKQQHSLPANS